LTILIFNLNKENWNVNQLQLEQSQMSLLGTKRLSQPLLNNGSLQGVKRTFNVRYCQCASTYIKRSTIEEREYQAEAYQPANFTASQNRIVL
jgi:hypothetical protein